MQYARRLLIRSVQNMRELGGYTTMNGGMTKWGRFIRSNAPLELSEDDIRFLLDYGVRTVVDLRAPAEIAWKPTPLSDAGLGYVNIPFTDDFTYLSHPLYCPRDHLVPVIEGRHRAADILRALAYGEGAALFFCYAGKDRTGMIAALLLLAAGVSVEDVMADYQVTYTYIRGLLSSESDGRERLNLTDSGGVQEQERPEELRRTEPEWIMPFNRHVLSYGGIDGFLKHIGLSGTDIRQLKARLLD